MDFYTICWIVLIYGFIGWCCEVIFAAVEQGKFVNRGFLNGPICPIYGLGMLLVLWVLTPLKTHLWLLFFGSVLLCTVLEYVTGFLLEKLFHQKWWDYSKYPFHLQGYVCLKFSLLWGLGAMFAVWVVHPPIALLLEKLPKTAGMPLLIFFWAVFASDLAVTLIAVLKLPRQLRAIREVEQTLDKLSSEIGGHLYTGTEMLLSKEKDVSELKARLMARYAEAAASMSGVQRRVLQAFPDLSAGREKLMELLKVRRKK